MSGRYIALDANKVKDALAKTENKDVQEVLKMILSAGVEKTTPGK